ncbi:MAG: hypothetical protein WAW88_15420, partial [Nocardioides sp.]
AAVGELGLAGEVRRVRDLPQRLAEAARLGFQGAVVPAVRGQQGSRQRGGGDHRGDAPTPTPSVGLLLHEVDQLQQALHRVDLAGPGRPGLRSLA